MQTHVGGTQITRDTDKIGLMSAVTIDDVLLSGLADTGNRDGQSGIAAGGIATNDINAPLVAGHSQSAIELLDILDTETLTESQRDCHLARCAIHGENVTDVNHCRLPTEMLEVDICQIEVYALHEHVGGDEHFCIWIVKYGAVIAYAVLCRLIVGLDVIRQTVYQAKFS